MFELLTESQKIFMTANLKYQIAVKTAGLKRLYLFPTTAQTLIIQTEAEIQELELQLKSLG